MLVLWSQRAARSTLLWPSAKKEVLQLVLLVLVPLPLLLGLTSSYGYPHLHGYFCWLPTSVRGVDGAAAAAFVVVEATAPPPRVGELLL